MTIIDLAADMGLPALGTCPAVGYAAVAGIQLDALAIDLEGDIDLRVFLDLAQGHAGFDSITAKVKITSAGPRAELEALARQGQRVIPVGHTSPPPSPSRSAWPDATSPPLTSGAARQAGATCRDGPPRWSGRSA